MQDAGRSQRLVCMLVIWSTWTWKSFFYGALWPWPGSIFTSVHFIIIESSGVRLQSSCWMVQTFVQGQGVFHFFIFSEFDVEFGIRVQKFVLSLRQDSEKGGEGQ